MTEQERQILLKALEKRHKKAVKSKKAALRFLIEIGALTEKGNLRAPYKNVCTQGEAA